MAKEKVNLYLLAIVAVVAVVGIIVLILDAGTTSLSISDDDLTGQVAKSAARMQTRDCNGAGEFICGAGHCCNGYTHDCTNSQCTPKP